MYIINRRISINIALDHHYHMNHKIMGKLNTFLLDDYKNVCTNKHGYTLRKIWVGRIFRMSQIKTRFFANNNNYNMCKKKLN